MYYLHFQENKSFCSALQGHDLGGHSDTHPLSPIHNFEDHHYSQTACDRKIGRKGQENVRNQVQIWRKSMVCNEEGHKPLFLFVMGNCHNNKHILVLLLLLLTQAMRIQFSATAFGCWQITWSSTTARNKLSFWYQQKNNI